MLHTTSLLYHLCAIQLCIGRHNKAQKLKLRFQHHTLSIARWCGVMWCALLVLLLFFFYYYFIFSFCFCFFFFFLLLVCCFASNVRFMWYKNVLFSIGGWKAHGSLECWAWTLDMLLLLLPSPSLCVHVTFRRVIVVRSFVR